MKITTNQERLNELFDSDPRSMTSIADELGVSKQAVSAWRTGIRSPKKSVLEKIAEIYNVSIEWLMGYDVEKNGTSRLMVIPDTELFRKLITNMTHEDYETVMRILERTELAMREKGLL